jgi:hypothetical protein
MDHGHRDWQNHCSRPASLILKGSVASQRGNNVVWGATVAVVVARGRQHPAAELPPPQRVELWSWLGVGMLGKIPPSVPFPIP